MQRRATGCDCSSDSERSDLALATRPLPGSGAICFTCDSRIASHGSDWSEMDADCYPCHLFLFFKQLNTHYILFIYCRFTNISSDALPPSDLDWSVGASVFFFWPGGIEIGLKQPLSKDW